MCAWSVSRSISALHSRGLGMTCDHSEKGRFVVTITAAFSAAASVHLIAQVKANQPALHHAIVALCDTAAPVDSTQTADKKRRCRDETRTVEVFAPGGSLADTEWDGHIRAIIRVNRDVLTRSATTGLWRDTLVCQRRRAASRSMCQSHPWPLHIENRSHYVRDGSFAEDASRIRCNPGIFARRRSFAANILRFNGIHNVSDGRHRIAFGGRSAILAMRVMY